MIMLKEWDVCERLFEDVCFVEVFWEVFDWSSLYKFLKSLRVSKLFFLVLY